MSNICQTGDLTPTHEVLATPELLEVILLHLPLRDLLFSQKVCTHWKAIVDTSPNIKKALFLVPDTHIDQAASTQPHSVSAPRPLAINDLILAYVQPGLGSIHEAEHYVGCYAIRSAALQARFEASCRKMYLSRPSVDAELYFTAEVTSFADLINLEAPELNVATLSSEQNFGNLMQRYHARSQEVKQRGYEITSEVKIDSASLQRFLPYDEEKLEADMLERWMRDVLVSPEQETPQDAGR
ncbi:hypothetical protein LTR56_002811 [Elasticomyces elasticus]|nr:hypothetical protein LTR56_002811 [Elasticomyces elasticus]KAK3666732.1 hypothetical protein LTR22_002319 [Elasticomyces elasticus]KAK4920426.1 hypothetical protein LTR49_012018 [Elasticomyces elasticus]KAK5759287.1 hypothetical protein LTS12_010610 [Elasticomyces elasticus]